MLNSNIGIHIDNRIYITIDTINSIIVIAISEDHALIADAPQLLAPPILGA